LCYPLKTSQLNSFFCTSYFGFIYLSAINQPINIMKVNLLHTLTEIIFTTIIDFSQYKVQLNVSESQINRSLESLKYENIFPNLSLTDLKPYNTIRNNEVHIGDINIADSEDFENTERKVIYKNKDLNAETLFRKIKPLKEQEPEKNLMNRNFLEANERFVINTNMECTSSRGHDKGTYELS